jgi:Protein of unknown function (DUF5131)
MTVHPDRYWDDSWNPVSGCSLVSPGCTNCFAQRHIGDLIASHDVALYRGVTDFVNGHHVFNGTLKNQEPGDKDWTWPLRWPGVPHPVLGPSQPSVVFVVVIGDLFHEHRPTSIIEQVVDTMDLSDHIGLFLTKRPEPNGGDFCQETIVTQPVAGHQRRAPARVRSALVTAAHTSGARLVHLCQPRAADWSGAIAGRFSRPWQVGDCWR